MHSPKVLLVNPWITDFAAYDFWQRPLGLMFIASVLRNAGLDVSLVDCLDPSHPSQAGTRRLSDGSGNFLKTQIRKPDVLGFVPRNYCRYGISLDDFDSLLRRAGRPDIALVTCAMTYWYPGAEEAISRIRKIWGDIPVVLGGRYATLCPQHAKGLGADYVHSGPMGEELSGILSVAAGIEVNFPSSFVDFPEPAHDLAAGGGHTAVIFSAGCPMKCTYCVSHLLCGEFKRKSVDDSFREIERIATGGRVCNVAFYDDALLYKAEEFLLPLLKQIEVSSCNRLSFYTPNALHARYLSADVAHAMKKAGFRHIRLGFESSSTDFQKTTGGKTGNDELGAAAEALYSAGFSRKEVAAYVMFGHPMQDEGELERTVDDCIALGVTPVSADYSPIPGSADFELARRTFERDPAGDPLLQNSSIAMYQHPLIKPEFYQAMRDRCRAAARRFSTM